MNPIVKFFQRAIQARKRLLCAFSFAFICGWFLPSESRYITRWLLAWNMGVWLYLTLIAHMMWQASRQVVQKWRGREDEGRTLILILSALAVCASLGATVAQLAGTKDLDMMLKWFHIALSVGTLTGGFFFIHTTFALHYAHEFMAQHGRGLLFPDTEHPDYIDFLYFSFVIGVAGQTADVALSSTSMRSLVTIHCILSFFFNATILALTVNIAAGVI